jgi:hypothetical protein
MIAICRFCGFACISSAKRIVQSKISHLFRSWIIYWTFPSCLRRENQVSFSCVNLIFLSHLVCSFLKHGFVFACLVAHVFDSIMLTMTWGFPCFKLKNIFPISFNNRVISWVKFLHLLKWPQKCLPKPTLLSSEEFPICMHGRRDTSFSKEEVH